VRCRYYIIENNQKKEIDEKEFYNLLKKAKYVKILKPKKTSSKVEQEYLIDLGNESVRVGFICTLS